MKKNKILLGLGSLIATSSFAKATINEASFNDNLDSNNTITAKNNAKKKEFVLKVNLNNFEKSVACSHTSHSSHSSHASHASHRSSAIV